MEIQEMIGMKQKFCNYARLAFMMMALSLILGCSSGGTPPPAPPAIPDTQQTVNRALEISYLRLAMDTSLVRWASIEACCLSSLRKTAPNNDSCLGFRVYQGQDTVNNGIRAEASCDFPFIAGDSVVYQWQLFLASDFDSTMPANTWCIVGQWHDQPDTAQGETWAAHPAMSPPVSINYGPLNGSDCLGLRYGAWPVINDIGTFPIVRNRWLKLTVEIRWSQGNNGSIRLFLDDTLQLTAVGPNMNNSFRHYFKFGMYRHAAIPSDNWIYLRGLTIVK